MTTRGEELRAVITEHVTDESEGESLVRQLKQAVARWQLALARDDDYEPLILTLGDGFVIDVEEFLFGP